MIVSNIGDDVNPGADRWIGSAYYRWVNATLGTYHALIDLTPAGRRVAVPPFVRPIVYVRGDPA